MATSTNVDLMRSQHSPLLPPTEFPSQGLKDGIHYRLPSEMEGENIESPSDLEGEDVESPSDLEGANGMPAGAPASQDLTTDLHKALSPGVFDAAVTFASAIPLLGAPNPGLHISGIGLIGLPLNEHEAKRVVAALDNVPHDRDSSIVVNTAVRGMRDVEAACVKLDNPEWAKYVEEKVVGMACKALGIPARSTPPRCELCKLSLYENGSHLLPQDAQESLDVFATIAIVLPSDFTGGEVHVTHSSKTEVLDVASSSRYGLSLLTWYADLVHEVKPVTSGHRFILLYNLIHLSEETPKPVAPDLDVAGTQFISNIANVWETCPQAL